MTDSRLTMYLSMFLAGWNDASQGPLLPSLQRIYNVDYLVSKSATVSSLGQRLTVFQSVSYGS
jgi:hypothetical protein